MRLKDIGGIMHKNHSIDIINESINYIMNAMSSFHGFHYFFVFGRVENLTNYLN